MARRVTASEKAPSALRPDGILGCRFAPHFLRGDAFYLILVAKKCRFRALFIARRRKREGFEKWEKIAIFHSCSGGGVM